jgi:hypothetical protein
MLGEGFKKGSHNVAQAGLELAVLLLLWISEPRDGKRFHRDGRVGDMVY